MSWTYQVDPAYNPHGEVPGHAVVAAAPCDAEGKVTGEWQPNPNYQPSVLATLLNKLPSDQFLLTFGRYLRGEVTTADFRRSFEETEFDVLATDDRGSLLIFNLGDGPAYSLITSPEMLPADNPPPTVRLRGSQILPIAADCAGFVIDRMAVGSLWLPLADLTEAE